MILNPRIEINLTKIKQNTEKIVSMCLSRGINVAAVTKVFCADIPVVRAILEAGVKTLADSRVQNIKHLRDNGIKAEMELLRIPMISEARDVVGLCDISLNTEEDTIKALSEEAEKLGKIHKIILMVDVGDLREGIWPDHVLTVVRKIKDFKGIRIYGVGTNVGCYGGVVPTYGNTKILLDIKKDIEKELGYPLEVVSGGSSTTLRLIEAGDMPEGVNQLRIGEGIVLGTSSGGYRVPGVHYDAVKIYAEVIEIKEKPSVPIGEREKDAFGRMKEFLDKGVRKRAILAIGRQDIVPETLIPVEKGIEILGGSSDHLILDITEYSGNLRIGDEIAFIPEYSSLLAAMTSKYVEKVYI